MGCCSVNSLDRLYNGLSPDFKQVEGTLKLIESQLESTLEQDFDLFTLFKVYQTAYKNSINTNSTLQELLSQSKESLQSMSPDKHILILVVSDQYKEALRKAFFYCSFNKFAEELSLIQKITYSLYSDSEAFLFDTLVLFKALIPYYKDKVTPNTFEKTRKQFNSVCALYNDKLSDDTSISQTQAFREHLIHSIQVIMNAIFQ